MLDIAFELFGEATSNSLLMFCFCNLIIVMILTGSSKPASMDSQDSSTFASSVSNYTYNIASDDHDCGDDDDDNDGDEEIAISAASSGEDESSINDMSDSDEEENRGRSHCCDYDDEDDDDDVDDEDDDDDVDDEDDDDDVDDDDDDDSKETEVEEAGGDDLRKRVEEFIAKVNNEWRHEKRRSLNLVC